MPQVQHRDRAARLLPRTRILHSAPRHQHPGAVRGDWNRALTQLNVAGVSQAGTPAKPSSAGRNVVKAVPVGFQGSPVLSLVELVGRVVPLFQATTLLVDPAPRVGPRVARAAGGADAH